MGLLKNILGKKKMSKDEFAEGILELESKWAKNWSDFFNNRLNINSGDIIEVESHILALFIITISIPNNLIRDMIHDKFCKRLGNGSNGFLEYLSSNYEKYNRAFNIWSNNPKQGFVISQTIISIMNESVEDEISVGIIEEPMIFSTFMEMFKSTLNFIKKIENDYEIEGL